MRKISRTVSIQRLHENAVQVSRKNGVITLMWVWTPHYLRMKATEKETKADLTKTKGALEKDKTKSESEKANLMGGKKCRIKAWCCEGRKAGQGKGSRGEVAQEVTVEVPGAQGCH
jgi:hypothetical protein